MNKLHDWKDIGAAGGFTTGDVGRLLHTSPSQIASWLRGSPPLIEADYEPINGRPILSFDALVEARAIAHFLQEGVRLVRLREILADLRRTTGKRHPLASERKLVTDGFRLLEVTEQGQLVNLANEVYAHADLMKPALVGRVVFEAGRPAFFLPDPKLPLVRVDPRIAFGRPVVVEKGKRPVETAAVAATAEDEGVAHAAQWFDLTRRAVSQAVDFERRLAA